MLLLRQERDDSRNRADKLKPQQQQHQQRVNKYFKNSNNSSNITSLTTTTTTTINTNKKYDNNNNKDHHKDNKDYHNSNKIDYNSAYYKKPQASGRGTKGRYGRRNEERSDGVGEEGRGDGKPSSERVNKADRFELFGFDWSID